MIKLTYLAKTGAFLFFFSNFILLHAEDTLQSRLDQKKEASKGKVDPQTIAIFENGIRAIDDASIPDHAPKIGDNFPSFTLPDSAGNLHSLESYLKKGPIVITFYRGGWCPYCNIRLAYYQEHLTRFKALEHFLFN